MPSLHRESTDSLILCKLAEFCFYCSIFHESPMFKRPVDPIVGIHEQEYMQFLKYYTKATPSSDSFECKGDNSSEADLH